MNLGQVTVVETFPQIYIIYFFANFDILLCCFTWFFLSRRNTSLNAKGIVHTGAERFQKENVLNPKNGKGVSLVFR